MSKIRTKSTGPSMGPNIDTIVPYFGLIIFILAFLLYSNTLGHDFAQDDSIVITQNNLTQKGVNGLVDIFTTDSFFGYFNDESKATLVAGGRYRPFTIAMFALEHQLFGNTPFVGHLINALLYGLLGFVIYLLLKTLLKNNHYAPELLAAIISLVFVAHPIHTEAVANIKGRDEIMAMLASIITFYFVVRFIDTDKIKFLLWSFLWFFIGLLSKENTITYLAVIPLGIYLFRDKNFRISSYLGIGLASIIFIVIRFSIIGFDSGEPSNELLNNPFLKWNGTSYINFTTAEKASTIVYTLGKYLQLMIFPYPLTHDYYPRHIEIMTFGNWKVLLSLITMVAVLALSFVKRKKHPIPFFGILYYVLTMSIVSNIVFPIGTNMSERFLFMPSLGLIIAYVYLMHLILNQKLFLGLNGLIIVVFGIMTVNRNQTWKNNFSLFTTDVHTSSGSAKVLNAAGGALVENYANSDDLTNTVNLLPAIQYLTKATEIHPTYKTAYLIKGNALFYLKKYEEANLSYRKAISLDLDYQEAFDNLAISLREHGKERGENYGDVEGAIRSLNEAVAINNQDGESWRLLGVANGVKGDHQKAIENLEMAVQLMPENASIYLNLGRAYQYLGDESKAQTNMEKAVAIDPNILK